MSSSNCCFLNCTQVSQEAGQVVWYSHLSQNFPQLIVIHTVKGFGIVNNAEIDVFLELSCFFDDLGDVGNLISGSSPFPKTSLNIWKFTVHVFLKPGVENFEHYFTSVWDECNCAVVWTFLDISFLWKWNENWPFPVLQPLLNFPNSCLQFSSVTQSCLTLCDPMNCCTPGLPIHHQLPEFTQTHVHLVSDAIQPSHPLLSSSPPAPNPSQHQGLFQWVLCMRWPKYWSFSFSIIPSKEIPGLISFRMDWLDLLAVQGTLKSLLQHHSSKASILRCSAFFTVQLSHPYEKP